MPLFKKCEEYVYIRELVDKGIYPYFHELESKQDIEVMMEGKRRIMLGSNNYLGLTVNQEVIDAGVEAMKKYSGVYFGAIGGAGALLAKCIKKCELIAYEDLGAEALRRLYVEDMPLFVIIDCQGNNLYESGRQEYLRHHGEERAE